MSEEKKTQQLNFRLSTSERDQFDKAFSRYAASKEHPKIRQFIIDACLSYDVKTDPNIIQKRIYFDAKKYLAYTQQVLARLEKNYRITPYEMKMLLSEYETFFKEIVAWQQQS